MYGSISPPCAESELLLTSSLPCSPSSKLSLTTIMSIWKSLIPKFICEKRHKTNLNVKKLLSNRSGIPRKQLNYNLRQNARNTLENFAPFRFHPPYLCNAIVPCTFVITSHHCSGKGKCMGVSGAFGED